MISRRLIHDLIDSYIMPNGKCRHAFSSLPPANEVWGKVIFSVARIENSVWGGGGGLPQCMLRYPPQEQTPPRPGTPQDQAPPGSRHPPDQAPPRTRHPLGTDTPQTRHPLPAQCMLGDTVNKWAVYILLECNLVRNQIGVY